MIPSNNQLSLDMAHIDELTVTTLCVNDDIVAVGTRESEILLSGNSRITDDQGTISMKLTDLIDLVNSLSAQMDALQQKVFELEGKA